MKKHNVGAKYVIIRIDCDFEHILIPAFSVDEKCQEFKTSIVGYCDSNEEAKEIVDKLNQTTEKYTIFKKPFPVFIMKSATKLTKT